MTQQQGSASSLDPSPLQYWIRFLAVRLFPRNLQLQIESIRNGVGCRPGMLSEIPTAIERTTATRTLEIASHMKAAFVLT
mmetsp:Transcript_116243/g.182870  ORF Transcript_116243/g.182870 Transcript_116243/m.182870 type:complete len:80 (-) Transcript_116243:1088-1327(-)